MVRNRSEVLDVDDPPACHGAGSDAIAGWLDVFIKLLRLSPAEQREIREELDSHLSDRVRDLMLGGVGEEPAIQRAISELGEAAQLAERFYAARKRPFLRRHAMNLTVLAVAGAAAIMSIIAISSPAGQPRPQALDGAPAAFTPAAAQPLADIRVPLEFKQVPLRDVLHSLAEHTGRPYLVHWRELEEFPVEIDQPLTLQVQGRFSLPTALRLVNDGAGRTDGDQVEFRPLEDAVEVGPRWYFDRREAVLLAYDLSHIVAKGESGQTTLEVLMELVEPHNWVNNGGDIAVGTALASRLFIQAPPRMHERIQWILAQLPTADPPAAQGVPRPGDREDVKHYRLRHTSATEALTALKRLREVREVDLAIDERTNTIIGKGPESSLLMVRGALAVLDARPD